MSSAKERRLQRRAAARAEGEGGSQGNAATRAASDTSAAAEEREGGKGAAARATKRTEAPTKTLAAAAASDPVEAAAATGNAKQRRMAARAAAFASKPPTPQPGPQDAQDAGSGKHKIPHVLFVGQLTFRTTAAQIEEHFRRGGIEGPMKVRLLTKQGSERSRGMAFVEVESADMQYKCLPLHHTRLDGRLINVERTTGGREKEKRKARIQGLREEQKEVMSEAVQRIIAEWKAKGKLAEDELDEQALGALPRFEARVIERALEEYCEKMDKGTLRNRSAYFLHVLHKLAFDEDVDMDAWGEERKAARSKRKAQDEAAQKTGRTPRKRPKQGANEATSALHGAHGARGPKATLRTKEGERSAAKGSRKPNG